MSNKKYFNISKKEIETNNKDIEKKRDMNIKT
jgi:hypothetical protein